MIFGAHTVIHSTDAEADRAFFRDVLGLDHVDVGGGWLTFALPPGEVAFHPSDGPRHHELYLMTDDIEAELASLATKGVEVSEVSDEGWGLLASFTLPGGGTMPIYQPRHPTAF